MSTTQREGRCVVRAAEWPLDEKAAADLLRNYALYLASGPRGTPPIDCSSLLGELTMLPSIYSPPHRVLLIAWFGSAAVGCVALRRLAERQSAFEMKRLWTESDARGLGAGRCLAEGAIAWARAQGANTLLLDTQPEAMPQAVALYRSLGFTETERYNDNPVPGLLFMELRLD